ncbi:Retrovirus-related Pol polyprotein from transposon TNT 1-94 [Eumeta japonica]|uniref:Retrovirus-related Pol polyprotein from transposon TNT 1-94 n=1 Tax=Eumeta variegata TaxID=151549 RepID=A0A4C1U126_EUMVA|nr:Retrovirus-related Pol polyprotein from transposon TNT 1-94 [Eumeta japonica]
METPGTSGNKRNSCATDSQHSKRSRICINTLNPNSDRVIESWLADEESSGSEVDDIGEYFCPEHSEHNTDTSTDISDTEETQPEQLDAPSSSSDEDVPLSSLGYFRDDLRECIDPGTEVDPNKDVEAKSKIILLVEPINYVHLENATSSKQVWQNLQNAFEDSGLFRKDDWYIDSRATMHMTRRSDWMYNKQSPPIQKIMVANIEAVSVQKQNGLAERMNRMLVERAKYMLFKAKLQNLFGLRQSLLQPMSSIDPHHEFWLRRTYDETYYSDTDDYYDDNDDIQRNITLRSHQKRNMQGSNAKQWKEVMDEEYKSLLDNNTWEITTLPDDKHSMLCKWVFKTKIDKNGDIVKYKARLVIKGCSQKPGINYTEVFSPVVRVSSLRYLFALAVKHDLDICQMDAVSAFLQGDIEEEIYMKQPPMYENGQKENHWIVLKHVMRYLKGTQDYRLRGLVQRMIGVPTLVTHFFFRKKRLAGTQGNNLQLLCLQLKQSTCRYHLVYKKLYG